MAKKAQTARRLAPKDFTDEDVRQIRRLLKAGKQLNEVCQELGIAYNHRNTRDNAKKAALGEGSFATMALDELPLTDQSEIEIQRVYPARIVFSEEQVRDLRIKAQTMCPADMLKELGLPQDSKHDNALRGMLLGRLYKRFNEQYPPVKKLMRSPRHDAELTDAMRQAFLELKAQNPELRLCDLALQVSERFGSRVFGDSYVSLILDGKR